MKPTIYFDMDGTIADLYGVNGWLEYLIKENVFPYENAEPLLRLCSLARVLNRLQREGYRIGIISWLSKSGSEAYNEAVTETKLDWLAEHLPSVHWDKIIIVPYGTPKENFCRTAKDILFDDEERNRNNWTGKAFNVDNILGVLTEM